MTDPKKKTGLLKKLLVMGVAFIAFALLAEGLVVLFLGEQVKFPRHVVEAPWNLRYNQPGAHYRHKSPDVEIWFDINEQGMREDEDVAYEKAPGRKRILSLGDSFTIGYEVSEEDCFSSVLERELRDRGYDVEVLNCGVSGFSTAEEMLYLERELFKYHPDLVLVSFYSNDIRDNIRTGLFKLDPESDELVQLSERYVPMGRVANWLNRNPILSWLSQHSNAFALLKNTATAQLKDSRVQENKEKLKEGYEAGEKKGNGEGYVPPEIPFAAKLCCALYERIYRDTQAQGIPLVIQSIPNPGIDRESGEGVLKNRFPIDCFDTERPGLAYLDGRDFLMPFFKKELLYWQRSNKHWTPFSHHASGKALAELIDERGLLK
ncbi:MAG TPA: hypothetical protein ENJ09_13415 [Planctomycetes bacterium]|nr:hypothetical protein [Planctomycetota bacterium]